MNPYEQWLLLNKQVAQYAPDAGVDAGANDGYFYAKSQLPPNAPQTVNNAAVRQNQVMQPPPVKRQNKAAKNDYMFRLGAEDGYHGAELRDGRLANRVDQIPQGRPYNAHRTSAKLIGPRGRLPAIAGVLGGAQGVGGAADLYNQVQQMGPVGGYAKWLGLQTQDEL